MCHCDPDLSGEAILKGLRLLRQFLHCVQNKPRNDIFVAVFLTLPIPTNRDFPSLFREGAGVGYFVSYYVNCIPNTC